MTRDFPLTVVPSVGVNQLTVELEVVDGIGVLVLGSPGIVVRMNEPYQRRQHTRRIGDWFVVARGVHPTSYLLVAAELPPGAVGKPMEPDLSWPKKVYTIHRNGRSTVILEGARC